MKDRHDYWSDYWLNDGQAGEVFVDSKGQKPSYVKNHWRSELSGLRDASKVIDLACGAGSIFEDLAESKARSMELHASDISQVALDILKKRIPEVQALQCSTSEMPFSDKSFDAVVSQFGVEYAGIEAFSEAGRLVGPGGLLSIISHYENGYIDKRNEAFLAGARDAISSGFVEKAANITRASFKGSKTQIQQAKQAFELAEKELSDSLDKHPEGIHNHLYFGFKQLYLKRDSYYERDILGWLDAMKKDIEKNIAKVSEIRKVSLSPDDAQKILEGLIQIGLKNVDIKPMNIPASDDIFAWYIKANG